MRMTYSPQADALAVELTPHGRSVRTQKLAPGINVDWDKEGRLITLEILDASARYPKAELEQLGDAATWLTLAEAEEEGREEGGPTAKTLRGLLLKGRIPGRKRGRDWEIAAHDLWNYLESRSAAGRPGRRPSARKAAVGKQTKRAKK